MSEPTGAVRPKGILVERGGWGIPRVEEVMPGIMRATTR